MTTTTEFYDAKISVRSQIKYLPMIKGKLQLSENRYSLFKKTVFGLWLDIPTPSNDNHLLNYVLQHQVPVPQLSQECPPIIYKIGGHELHFGRREFCLITGFTCGQLPSETFSSQSPFCDRVFPHKRAKKKKNVKGKELLDVLENEKLWSELTDEDAVRVCLLLVAEAVFMGRELGLNLPRYILTLVEDFSAWNEYPWGEYMWSWFYKRNVNVVPKHALKMKEKDPKKLVAYNLNGFVWALKIWILESYPNSKFWWVKQPGVIPRCLAWSNKQQKFEKSDYDDLFLKGIIPNLDLDPTVEESEQAWWIDSHRFSSGEVRPVVQAVQGEDHDVHAAEEDHANDVIPQEISAESMDIDQEKKLNYTDTQQSSSQLTSNALTFVTQTDPVVDGLKAVQREVATVEVFEEDDANDDIPVTQYKEEQKENGEVIYLVKEEKPLESIPILHLVPTVEESKQAWWIDSHPFFIGEDHDVHAAEEDHASDVVPHEISAESMDIDQEKKLNYTVQGEVAAVEGFEEDRANDIIPVMQYAEEQKENGEVIDLVKEEKPLASSLPPDDAVSHVISADSMATDQGKELYYACFFSTPPGPVFEYLKADKSDPVVDYLDYLKADRSDPRLVTSNIPEYENLELDDFLLLKKEKKVIYYDFSKEEKTRNERMELDKSVETSSPPSNDAGPREISADPMAIDQEKELYYAAEEGHTNDALRRKVNCYRPDLVDRIEEFITTSEAMESVLKLRTTVEVKLDASDVVNHDTKTSSPLPNDAAPRGISADPMTIDQENKFYTDTQQYLMQHLINALSQITPPDCFVVSFDELRTRVDAVVSVIRLKTAVVAMDSILKLRTTVEIKPEASVVLNHDTKTSSLPNDAAREISADPMAIDQEKKYYTDTQKSSMQHLINAFVQIPLPNPHLDSFGKLRTRVAAMVSVLRLRTTVEAMESILKLRTTVEVKPDASVVPREVSAESMATDQVRPVYSMIRLIDACLYSEAELKAVGLDFSDGTEDEFSFEGQYFSNDMPAEEEKWIPYYKKLMGFKGDLDDIPDILYSLSFKEKEVKYYDFAKEEKMWAKSVEYQMIKSTEVNVAKINDRPRLKKDCMQRKKKARTALRSPDLWQPPPTPRAAPKRRFRADGEDDSLEPFVEDLQRHSNCNREEVTLPECIELPKEIKQSYWFPLGLGEIDVDDHFWSALLCVDKDEKGWLLDNHLQIWVDLMWRCRAHDADWSMAGPSFCALILRRDAPPCYANTKLHPVAWSDVEKVYFPLNEPGKHWALAELQIRTGLITIYDSLAPRNKARQETRGWWSNMRKTLAINLPLYLNEHEVLKSKGIHVEDYKITFQFAKNVPRQATKYGDCGIWVCIFLYRLTHNLPLDGGDSLQVALAYRESMFAYLWKNKVSCNELSKRSHYFKAAKA